MTDLDADRIAAFLRGEERRAWELFGPHAVEGGAGHRFAVWAPRARGVSVVGEFNGWSGGRDALEPVGDTGVWAGVVEGAGAGARYKLRVEGADGRTADKADPFARRAEVRPATASLVPRAPGHGWHDADWLAERARRQAGDAPQSVYEVHAGSWRRHGDGTWLGYRALADALLPYVRDLGFTHVELLPLTEHPLDESWGYQPTGFFAPTGRYGGPDDLRYFVDRAHQLGLGVFLDFVPGHFARDEHALARFDGAPLFEPEDARAAEHPDWGTLTFDYARGAVRSFLVSSALYWLQEFHVDGLRVDAVASMLYLDYSRGEGEWTPNAEGGNTNPDAVAFLRALNDAVHEEVPGALVVAEESTAWDGVTRATGDGGLGFDEKWNLGWMNDTLDVFGEEPVHRTHHHEKLIFSLHYAWSERFLLPLSHDEVVHGKGTLLGKMPGDAAQKLAHVRLLLAWQWLHPGKKLLFMGQELAAPDEWAVREELDWGLEEEAGHAGVRRLVGDLNRLYRERPALHELDFRPEGFQWLNARDAEHSTLAWARWAPGRRDAVVVGANFTPVTREGWRMPVPDAGRWRVVLNTDAAVYGGWDTLVEPEVEAEAVPVAEHAHSVTLRLPGLSAVALERVG